MVSACLKASGFSFASPAHLLSARQYDLGLLQGFHFLVASRLADIEVLRNEVARRMQLGIVVGELLEVLHCVILGLLGLDVVPLGLCLLLRLVGDILVLRLNGRVRLLDEILVRLLAVLLSGNSLGVLGLLAAVV